MVVIGGDAVATAHAALGVLRAQALRRPVTVVDLVGDVAPLATIATGDDPHGISDCLIYGISLNRVGSRIPGIPNAIVIPSGTDGVGREEIFRHERWRRIIAAARADRSLLLLVVRSGTPGAAALLESTDGAIAVGAVPDVPTDLLLAAIPAPVKVEESPPPAAWPAARRAGMPGDRRRYLVPALGGIALVTGWAWLAWTLLRADPSQTATGTAAGGIASAEVSETPPAAVAPRASRAPAAAAPYGVEVVATNTQAGAIINLQGELGTLPAATYAPVVLADGARWFKVIVGAYDEQSAADSLLGELRRRKLVQEGAGSVVAVPFTLLVEDDISREAAPGLVSAYTARGVPVYALLQQDGTARLFAGAFETPEQTAILAASLRSNGIGTVVTRRTGRVF